MFHNKSLLASVPKDNNNFQGLYIYQDYELNEILMTKKYDNLSGVQLIYFAFEVEILV